MAKPKKVPKLTAEQKLMQASPEELVVEGAMALLMPANIFGFVAQLVRLALDHGGPADREMVASMALHMREASRQRFGHDSVETLALVKLFNAPAAGWTPKPPRLDSITHMQANPHKPHRLTTEEEAAASNIIAIWAAYGKFLEMTGRGIGGGGSARSSAIGPVDVMGQDTWEHHQEVFGPWQAAASRVVVERRVVGGTHLTLAAVVFKVLVEDTYPEELDRHFALFGGTARKALKWGLNHYYAPERLADWAKKPPQPDKVGLQRETVVGSGIDGPPDAPTAPATPKRPPGLWVAPRPQLAPGEKIKLGARKPK